MKDQLPAPDFDRQKYERPNQDWICGWTCEGKPCRRGPTLKGECRTKFECRPILEKKPGQEKGRWRCTRAPLHGGPCETGPLPDGTCCIAIPKCVPVRSLRAKRGVMCLATMGALLGVILVAISGPWIWRFISPGPVSIHHQGAAFATMRQSIPGGEGCAGCHVAAMGGPRAWIEAGFGAKPGPFDVHLLAAPRNATLTQIDRACLNCHAGRNFHQPNTIRDHSCSSCHVEHQGGGRMKPPESSQCASCHNDAKVMQASLAKAQNIPVAAFNLHGAAGLNTFDTIRPPEGRTTVFASFSGGHPEFQFRRENLRDTNPLKFNHEKHLAGGVLQLNGRALECASCHQPDAAGKYYQRIAFETHCQSCHSLQFDAQNPELSLPHGDTSAVRTFLRTLSTQYAGLARNKGITRERDVERFAQDQINRLRRVALSGENLEKLVFFTADPARPLPTAAGGAESRRARFAGCAYCHEVNSAADDSPVVVAPRIPDRWMLAGAFNHSKHTNLSCANCHAAEHSRETADIILPGKDNCVACHSPRGGMSESCSVCHTFHLRMRK